MYMLFFTTRNHCEKFQQHLRIFFLQSRLCIHCKGSKNTGNYKTKRKRQFGLFCFEVFKMFVYLLFFFLKKFHCCCNVSVIQFSRLFCLFINLLQYRFINIYIRYIRLYIYIYIYGMYVCIQLYAGKYCNIFSFCSNFNILQMIL